MGMQLWVTASSSLSCMHCPLGVRELGSLHFCWPLALLFLQFESHCKLANVVVIALLQFTFWLHWPALLHPAVKWNICPALSSYTIVLTCHQIPVGKFRDRIFPLDWQSHQRLQKLMTNHVLLHGPRSPRPFVIHDMRTLYHNCNAFFQSDDHNGFLIFNCFKPQIQLSDENPKIEKWGCEIY